MDETVNASIASTKKKIDTVDKTEKPQKFPEVVVTSKNKKNYTVDKADNSKSIPVTNISNKSNQIENPSEIDIHRENWSVSVLSVQGESLSSVTPDQPCITWK